MQCVCRAIFCYETCSRPVLLSTANCLLACVANYFCTYLFVCIVYTCDVLNTRYELLILSAILLAVPTVFFCIVNAILTFAHIHKCGHISSSIYTRSQFKRQKKAERFTRYNFIMHHIRSGCCNNDELNIYYSRIRRIHRSHKNNYYFWSMSTVAHRINSNRRGEESFF